ncbi:MAG: hypothetical protein KME12_24470 [Trichocoleus desertorum ATA4-8-CV12]|jgi:hypothetical protein|nr:hypothetical protein [Trichocoleus desertorum ATA4-8-CV12]
MRDTRNKNFRGALAIVAAVALCTTAQAEDSPETAALKTELDLEKTKLEVAKTRADLYKSLVPELSDYKPGKPDAPQVLATTTRIAYLQADALAQTVAKEVHAAAGKLAKPSTPSILLLDSPNLVSYLSAADSVIETLKASTYATAESTNDLSNLLNAVTNPARHPKGNMGNGLRQRSLSLGLLALPALIESGFSIASAMRTQYVMTGTRHEDTSTKVLQAKTIGALGDLGIQLFDVDAYLPQNSTETAALYKAVQDQTSSSDAARKLLKTANKLATVKKEAGEKDVAERIEEQAGVLSGVLAQADKYLLTIRTPGDSGVSQMTAAIRGTWLRKQLATNPPRLSLASIVSSTDIVAADGLFKGLRVSVAGNTVVHWRLVSSEGLVQTGTTQACSDLASHACSRTVLRADDGFKK